MEFNEDELGTITAALAAYQRMLNDVEGAKVKGYIPPCFNPVPKAKEDADKLLSRVKRRHMV